MKINSLVNALKQVLADSQTLYLKTQNYHWNVCGPQFASLHLMFEHHYTELAEAVDTIAELIRSLGHKVPASLKDYSKITSISDGDFNLNAESMLKDLIESQQVITKSIQYALAEAEKAHDDVVVDAMVTRLATHKKNSWMLESSL